ncbi:MAG: Na+/H+ antiporter subunit E [Desulfurococcaceae archaeon]|nr:Na+/H+ antiporter subunit E [Sulfolobales archaeon]MDW8170747.1 Na+/H+ antiporter subunit E [Desulfurococcaceae archaeon]
MKRLAKAFGPIVLTFIIYITFSGSVSIYDLVSGVIVALVVGLLVANLVVSKPNKLLQMQRLAWLAAYSIYYFFVAEVKAHLDVIYRILHPKMPINPGIVRVPYSVETDYAMTTLANSITNTPGTVVVDLDQSRKIYYIHWIYIKDLTPTGAREHISEIFEKYTKKIFD